MAGKYEQYTMQLISAILSVLEEDSDHYIADLENRVCNFQGGRVRNL